MARLTHRSSGTWMSALWIVGVVALLSFPASAFKGVLGAGLDGGYSALALSGVDSPTFANGGFGRLRVFYGINEWLGVEISGTMTFYAPYEPWVVSEEDSSEWRALSPIDRLRTDTFQLALIYTFDIMKLQPYGSFGIGSTKSTWESAGIEERGYDVTLYINLGLDWLATRRFWPGLAVETLIPLTDDAPFDAATRVFLRATFAFKLF